MRSTFYWVFVGLLTLSSEMALCQDANNKGGVDAESSKTLKIVQNIERDSLKGVVGISTSSDGRFLYASAYTSAAIHAFSIDQQTGKLTLIEDIIDRAKLRGVTDFCLSPDGKTGVASAFASKAATLFQRETESGKLTMLHSVDANTSGLKSIQFPIRAAFSVDGRFVYVADSGISRSFFSASRPSVIVLKIVNQQLEFVESFASEEGILADVRGIAVHPNDKHLFVVSSAGRCLVSFRRDLETGKLELATVVRNGANDIDVLDGAMSVATDRSGKFIYTLAGRFRGRGAIGVFSFSAENSGLSLLEGHHSGSRGLEQFQGGNQLALSLDGQRLYAVGTASGTLSILQRDVRTGILTPIETVAFRPKWKTSVAGVSVSPDNRFVYVSGGELDTSITVLEVLP